MRDRPQHPEWVLRTIARTPLQRSAVEGVAFIGGHTPLNILKLKLHYWQEEEPRDHQGEEVRYLVVSALNDLIREEEQREREEEGKRQQHAHAQELADLDQTTARLTRKHQHKKIKAEADKLKPKPPPPPVDHAADEREKKLARTEEKLTRTREVDKWQAEQCAGKDPNSDEVKRVRRLAAQRRMEILES